jgi:hypothetical protein
LAERLYKYRAINAYTEAIFRGNELRFTAPVELNDPFECRIQITYGDVAREEIASIVSRLGEMEPTRSSEENRAIAEAIVSAPDRIARGAPFARQLIEYIRRDSAFLSLAEIRDNILMWSHYADNHRGICIELSIERCPTLSQVLPVQYSRTVPRFEFFRSSMKEVGLTTFLTKSEDWSYEREWRLVKVGKSSCNVSFNPAALTGVIFGCNCPAADRDKVKSWVAGRRDPVRILDARLVEEAFALEISESAA